MLGKKAWHECVGRPANAAPETDRVGPSPQYRVTAEGLCRAVRELLRRQRLGQVPGLRASGPQCLTAPFVSGPEGP